MTPSPLPQLAEEKRALEEAEHRASEEYIQRLLAEEEERRAEERRTLEERQLEEDERLARLISQELVRRPRLGAPLPYRPRSGSNLSMRVIAAICLL